MTMPDREISPLDLLDVYLQHLLDQGMLDEMQVRQIIPQFTRGIDSLQTLEALLSATIFDEGDKKLLRAWIVPQLVPIIAHNAGLSSEQLGEIQGFTSPADLADRLVRSGVNRNAVRELYEGILITETPTTKAIREAEVRFAPERQRRESLQRDVDTMRRAGIPQDRIQQIIEERQRKEAEFPTTFARGVEDVLIRNKVQREQALGRQRESARQHLIGAELDRAEAFRRQAAAERAGFLGREFGTRVPSAEPVIENIVGREGLEGTRLGAFLANEMASKARQLERDRLQWWQNLITQRENAIASPSQFAQLATLAQPGITAQELTSQGIPETVAQGTIDPVFRAFNPNFRQRFFQQPGAGLVPRLTPAVRFR